ncbi:MULTISPECIES: glycosyltransferase [unclassified Nodularia (in: cyanobacteria)]|uniref:glycosyltransferase n=1 Tax=unclassified Nodularia (in: cyanobacteria) TaxID=2656917 RepID=UPI0018814B17|nr:MULTISPECIES: glycosyltransferase [unclassified Nodularia (in: cyanobacteria)]MBE9199420.1 glycosyltransferase family 4 protein [Nodularia sp. LEGE 06071]MCC2692918.1 glycosyltransferase family 4 protein [Nodularia sp. LEGE 04288]
MNCAPNNLQIAILFANYGPYHIARVASAYHACKSSGCNVFGIELARSEVEYPWEIQLDKFPGQIHSVIDDVPLEKVKFSHLFGKLISLLNRTCPDVIAISGYARPSMLVTLLWCLWHGKSAILLSETTENDEPRSWWKEKIKKLLITRYKAALVGGLPHKRYLIKLGMPSEAIFLGYDVVGNDVFHPNQIKSLSCPLAQPFFLAINRFVSKKNLPFLLSAYAKYRQTAGTDPWDLVLCGDGELRLLIEEEITNHKMQNYVHLPGFLQQDQLLPYFAHAKCFIHASVQEQWGLVVNEAMAAGLPVLVSNRCGCYEDLIIEGVNGFGFDPENSQQLSELMLKMSSGEIDLEIMSNEVLEHIQQFSPDYFAQGLIQSVSHASSQR